jgi:hypothetical protein
VVRLGLAVEVRDWASWILALATYVETVKLADFLYSEADFTIF